MLDYQCLDGPTWSCVWFSCILVEPFALFNHKFVIKCVLQWCFTYEEKDPYANRTYVCHLELHRRARE